MTQFGSTPPTIGAGQPSAAQVAKDEAGSVASTATDAGKHVAGVAGEQAGVVKQETTQQAKALLEQTRSELTEQASTQQQRVAGGLRSLSEELGSMAAKSEQPGMATDLARQASQRAEAIAGWLEDREPGHVLEEASRFARQRPGAFLALAAGAGLLAGRFARGLRSASNDDSATAGSAPSAPRMPVTEPYAPATPVYPATQEQDPVGYVPAVGPYQPGQYDPLPPTGPAQAHRPAPGLNPQS
jgi:hypothetical protein